MWIECIRFECLYGSRSLVKEIYNASLVCLEPDLISVMTDEFEKLKVEFKYVLWLYIFMFLNIILILLIFRLDAPKDDGVIVIDD